ncbi:MAG: 2-oxo acid dehydrogenase subunit E2 [Lachnospiraceae bacterium]|jgi:pyruvate dehydrogenase E2 component (dihydrolipoamide acetyltransferase)|nr:2-oxo acid dehydrogenase subunit E2 [Lachnospiraceae bacterium]
MATEVYMPKNGMDMTEGTIIRWLKEEGDPVEKDEAIMEIETDKITMESEAPVSGILLKKLYGDGAVVPVLTTIGYIGEMGEKIPDTAPTAAPAAAPESGASAPPSAAAPSPAVSAGPVREENGMVAATPYARKLAEDNGIDLRCVVPTGRHGEVRGRDVEEAVRGMPKASPLAKAMAADLGIDLKTVAGSGYRGKIMSKDLQAVNPAKAEEEARVDAAVAEIERVIERYKMNGMRKVIAQRMFASHNEIPNVTQNIKIDVTELLALRETINKGKEKADRVSVNDMIIKAVGKVIQEQERFCMTLEGDEFVLHKEIHVGMAVGLPDGLLVPVIRDVDKKGLLQISREAKDLAKKAREGKLMPDDMGNGRITISNIGMFGTHSFTPIINQPEASIVGVCGTEDELALADGQVVVRKKMMVCVTFDHRILNGTEVCSFESRLKELLENPVTILL